MNYQDFFEGKRVTQMGLGLLGRGVGDAEFLARMGVELTITDLREEEVLAPSLAKLKKYKDIKYTLGRHDIVDFRDRDFILKAAGVPLDSPSIAEAKKQGIPIEMDASLFAKLTPKGTTIVGVTGTRGKSTTTALIYEILSSTKRSTLNAKRSQVYRGGNLVPEATLPLLEKVKTGDIVVLELDSWQLQGFHDAKISPQVAVFTTFLDDHVLYYRSKSLTASKERYFEDKVAIFKYQKSDDVLIAGDYVTKLIGKSAVPVSGYFVVATKDEVPKEWTISIPGEHNLENIACALKVAEHFKIPLETVKKAVESFKGIPGRLEYLRTVNGVKIYNDTNATTPDATIAGLKALRELGIRNYELGKEKKNIILICGGTDKGLDMSKLVVEIPKYCKAVVFLKETGTEKLISNFQFPISNQFSIFKEDTLRECVDKAMEIARRGDTVLFSPAFASFGKWFKNEYDRGEQFVKIVSRL